MKKQIKKYCAALTLLLMFTIQTTQAHSKENNNDIEFDEAIINNEKIKNNKTPIKFAISFNDKKIEADCMSVYLSAEKVLPAEKSTLHQLRNKFSLEIANEQNAPYLYAMIEKYATKLEIPVPTIFINFNEFHNACATSLSHNISAIMIGVPLLASSTTQEIEAIIAHELAHIKHNHITRGYALYFASYYALGSVIAPLLLPENLIMYCSDYLPFCVYPITPFIIAAAMFIARAHGRYSEQEADLTAISVLEQPAALGHFFEKLPGSNIQPEYTTFWEKVQYYLRTHPETHDRIAYCNAATQALENNNSSTELLAAPAA